MVDHTPSSKKISTSLLDAKYVSSKIDIKVLIKKAAFFSLCTDDWSNVRKEHLVNFVVHLPEQKPVFWCAMDTSSERQDAQTIAWPILEVAEELDVKRTVALVTENAGNMKAAWTIGREAHPSMLTSGCAARVLYLFIQDICSLDSFKKYWTRWYSFASWVTSGIAFIIHLKKPARRYSNGPVIRLPAAPIWSRHYLFVKSFLDNRRPFQIMVIGSFLVTNKDTTKKTRVTAYINDAELWGCLEHVSRALHELNQLRGLFDWNWFESTAHHMEEDSRALYDHVQTVFLLYVDDKMLSNKSFLCWCDITSKFSTQYFSIWVICSENPVA